MTIIYQPSMTTRTSNVAEGKEADGCALTAVSRWVCGRLQKNSELSSCCSTQKYYHNAKPQRRDFAMVLYEFMSAFG